MKARYRTEHSIYRRLREIKEFRQRNKKNQEQSNTLNNTLVWQESSTTSACT